MVGRQDAGAHQGVQDGQPGTLGESTDLRRCPARPAASEEYWLLGGAQLFRDRGSGLIAQCWAVDGRWRHDSRLERLGEDVHRHRHENRAGSAGQGEIPRSREDARDLIRAAHAPRTLHERFVDRDLVGVSAEVELLVWASTLVIAGHVAGDHDERYRIERRGRDAGRRVGDTRTDVEKHNAGLAGCPGKPIGCVCCNLLVACSGEARRPVPLESSEQRDIRVTANAENLLDAAINKEVRDVVGNCRWARHGVAFSTVRSTSAFHSENRRFHISDLRVRRAGT